MLSGAEEAPTFDCDFQFSPG